MAIKEREHEITIVRVFDASPEELYAAWTVPELMRHWLAQRVQADVRVGGRYRNEVDAGEGQTFVHQGEYRVLEPGRRIVQTFRGGPDGTPPDEASPYLDETISVGLRPLGPSQTELTFTNGWDGEPLDDETKAAVRQGWTAWLDLLSDLFRKPI